jgi:hypothetical protein
MSDSGTDVILWCVLGLASIVSVAVSVSSITA